MNDLDQNIDYTFEADFHDNVINSNAFLNVKVIIRPPNTITDIFAKDTDTFNYLPFNSNHPRHTVRNIPWCLARIIRGIVSDPELVSVRMQEMKARLRLVGYPVKLINASIKWAMDIPREDILNPKPKNDTENNKEPIYFVSTYNPTLKDPKIEIRRAIDTYNTNEKAED